MPTPHKVVFTGKTGPDRSLAAMNFLNVERVLFDLTGKKLLVEVDNSNVAKPPTADGLAADMKELDLAAAATITVAVAAGAYTITVA